MPFGFNAGELNMIRSIFRGFPAIERVVIFGSRATGNFKAGSDVDLALEGNITDDILSRVRMRLNDELPLPYIFDLFNLKTIASKPLQEHIKRFGKVFFSKKVMPQS